MSEQEELNEIMQMILFLNHSRQLETLAVSLPANNVSEQRKKLAVFVSPGKTREVLGVQLSHEQVKRPSEKEVEKFYKRYEACRTTETLIQRFLMLGSRQSVWSSQ